MKKFLLSILAVGAIGLSASAQVTTYSVGDVVDNFTVTDTDGNTQDLYTITASGKHVFIDFFFDTCPPCQSSSPIFNEFYDKYGCNSGDVYCLSMNNGTDSDAEVIAYEQTYGGSFNHAPAVSADGGAGAVNSNFGVSAFPTICLIGPDNRIIELDIFPVSNVGTFEATFPSGFNPSPQACSFAGIEEDKLSGLSVFPNPANVEVNFTFDATVSETAKIEIVNLVGEVVLSQNVETTVGSNYNTLDVESLAAGQYIARIALSDQVSTFKFSKK
jgi:thiol-disulfide isomerase/thioredoxin